MVKMDIPLPNFQFHFMALWYKIRDMLAPRIKVLQEIGIRPGFRVLDFGCGPGSYIPPLSRLVGPEGRVYALDLHPLAIERVRAVVQKEKLKNVEVIQSDGATGLPDAGVDVVLLYELFHDLGDPERVLKELSRVLKPEGILSVTDPYIPEEAMLSGISRGHWFQLRQKGKKTHTFSKNGTPLAPGQGRKEGG
jgi:ubiquinone/menaquinone biosynthesis C-methylase UbiE